MWFKFVYFVLYEIYYKEPWEPIITGKGSGGSELEKLNK